MNRYEVVNGKEILDHIRMDFCLYGNICHVLYKLHPQHLWEHQAHCNRARTSYTPVRHKSEIFYVCSVAKQNPPSYIS